MPIRLVVRPDHLLRQRLVSYAPWSRFPNVVDHVQRPLPADARPLSTQSLPIILQPSFWRSLMPKALRGEHKESDQAQVDTIPKKSKDWNPATFFIVIFMLIGSQAIQMISLQRSFDLFSNQTEAKLSTLREVVRRIRNGEDVDVEGMLGTGDQAKEKEWDDVIRELEEEDARVQNARRRKRAKQAPGKNEAQANDVKPAADSAP